MKNIHKHIYTVIPRPASSSACSSTSSAIPRVRSGSFSSARSLYTAHSSAPPLSFFDAPPPPPPPPPSSRPGNPNIIVSTRLAIEAKAELDSHTDSPYSAQSHSHSYAPPSSLALASANSEPSSHIPATHFKPFFPYPAFASNFSPCSPLGDADSAPATKRQRTRYHLDVGAYGIPKRSRDACIAGRDGHGRLALDDGPHSQLRSDALHNAVQVGEDAYFVRDNAMGVADGVGGWSRVRRNTKGGDSGPSPSALFARRLMHYCSEEVEAASAESSADSSALETLSDIDADELRMELEDTLEDLEDGIDILQIFENAYEKTMQAHVCPDDAHSDPRPTTAPHDSSSSAHIPPAGQSARCPEQAASTHSLSSSSWSSVLSPPPPKTKRLTEGSSTALLAVLEHPTARSRSRPHGLFSPSPRTAPGPAVIRIAHLGDSMGMLIRGDEIVWRTDEMWWNFNTPVQLGPASPTRPRDAQVCTLPVQADDILILASDGLSDNLWDEDVLDEVVRARRPFLAAASASATPAQQTGVRGQLGRQALAAMLSEALCSRARRVAEMRRSPHRKEGESDGEDEEIPFARRAKEHGKAFRGGKPDDISVLVAVVSPVQTA